VTASSFLRYHAKSLRLLAIPGLAGLLGAPVGYWYGRTLPKHEALIGWGRRPVAERLKGRSHAMGLPFVRLEDGFIRSLALAKTPPHFRWW